MTSLEVHEQPLDRLRVCKPVRTAIQHTFLLTDSPRHRTSRHAPSSNYTSCQHGIVAQSQTHALPQCSKPAAVYEVKPASIQ